jgi:hypothetical protein
MRQGLIEQIQCANDIGTGEFQWIGQRPVYVRFSSKVNNSIDIIFLKNLLDELRVRMSPFSKNNSPPSQYLQGFQDCRRKSVYRD